MQDFLRELWVFMRAHRKFWLLPIVATMMIFGLLLLLLHGTATAPFIYTVF